MFRFNSSKENTAVPTVDDFTGLKVADGFQLLKGKHGRSDNFQIQIPSRCGFVSTPQRKTRPFRRGRSPPGGVIYKCFNSSKENTAVPTNGLVTAVNATYWVSTPQRKTRPFRPCLITDSQRNTLCFNSSKENTAVPTHRGLDCCWLR